MERKIMAKARLEHSSLDTNMKSLMEGHHLFLNRSLVLTLMVKLLTKASLVCSLGLKLWSRAQKFLLS